MKVSPANVLDITEKESGKLNSFHEKVSEPILVSLRDHLAPARICHCLQGNDFYYSYIETIQFPPITIDQIDQFFTAKLKQSIKVTFIIN